MRRWLIGVGLVAAAIAGALAVASDLSPQLARTPLTGASSSRSAPVSTGAPPSAPAPVSATLPASAPPAARPAAPVTARPCFGAASRDPLRPCTDRALARVVYPSPAEAALQPNAGCRPTGREGLLYPCRFGAPGPHTAEAVALVGDSHASHWRGAVAVVAQRNGRPAISLARSHCQFIDATALLPQRERGQCRRWNRQLVAWLRKHREVRTLFISNRSSGRFVTSRRRGNVETQVAGHMSQWRALPASIENVVVIRDTPRSSIASSLCVQQRILDRRAVGHGCSRARREALRPDPAAIAVRRLRSPRVHLVDLTRLFCSPDRCYPVVGGALVHKDQDHITAVFAQTLGQFLLRALNQIVREERGTPLYALVADERAAAECLIAERQLAARAGGWQHVEPERPARAERCRRLLLQRTHDLVTLGLTGERGRARRHEVIERVLDTER